MIVPIYTQREGESGEFRDVGSSLDLKLEGRSFDAVVIEIES